MSFLYVGSEENTVEQTLDKRLIYLADSENQKYKNLVDFNFGEKFLYGRVRRDFRTMYLSSTSENLKGLGAIDPLATPPQALNFVVDMFNRLNTQFIKCSTIGTISADDPFLSTLKVYKAYQDPVALHVSFLQRQFSVLSNQLKGRKFDNLSFFLEEILNLLSQTLKLYPITFAGFVKSRFCPIFSSGLCLEIADSDYFDDQNKIEQFYNSPNWEFYLNACRTYGFMIDKNVPWRIVADIGSSEALEYSIQYDLVSTDNILATVYEETEIFFFNKLKFYILNLYNQTVTTFAEPYDCNGVQRTRYVKIPQININSFDSQITDAQMLKFYYQLRLMESDKKLSNSQKIRLLDDCMQLYSTFGLTRSMNRFVKIICQPFDSVGSLSYINETNKRLREDK